MDYHSISSPKWVDAAHTMISIQIVFPSLGDSPVNFNASPHDVMPYGVDIYNDLVAGKYGLISEFVAAAQ